MAADSSLVVRPVVLPAEWRAFHRFKSLLDRRDPASVRLLDFQLRLQLDPHRNPFYEHAEREAFLAYRGGQVVGRIVAIVDHLHQATHHERTGFFGFFEALDDPAIAASLLAAASDWLAARGCDAARGPVNPSLKSDFGVLVEGFAQPPYVMMGHNPPYYARLLEQCGCEVVRTFLTFELDQPRQAKQFAGHWQAYELLAARIRERYPQISIRTANPRQLAAEIRSINALGDRVRSENWGFVPFTPAELEHSVRQLQRVLRPNLVYQAWIDDQLIGYLLAMPDLNDALRHAYGPWDWLRLPQVAWHLRRTRRVRVFGVGIDPTYRHTGLLALLTMRLVAEHRAEFDYCEFSWIDSTNRKSIGAVSRFVPLHVAKTYHLYQRSIPASAPAAGNSMRDSA